MLPADLTPLIVGRFPAVAVVASQWATGPARVHLRQSVMSTLYSTQPGECSAARRGRNATRPPGQLDDVVREAVATASHLYERSALLLGEVNAARKSLPLSTLDAFCAVYEEMTAVLGRISAAVSEVCIEADDRGQECPLPEALRHAILRADLQACSAHDCWLDAEIPARRRGRVTKRTSRSLVAILAAQAGCLADVAAAFRGAFRGVAAA